MSEENKAANKSAKDLREEIKILIDKMSDEEVRAFHEAMHKYINSPSGNEIDILKHFDQIAKVRDGLFKRLAQ